MHRSPDSTVTGDDVSFDVQWCSRLLRLAGLNGSDAVGPHHLVVLVFDDVAVPHVLAGEVELGAALV